MKVALDSNILVRAHQKAAGPARALLLELLEAGHRLILSATILEELDRVLHYPRLRQRSNLTLLEITGYLAFLAASAQIVQVDEALAPPIRDPQASWSDCDWQDKKGGRGEPAARGWLRAGGLRQQNDRRAPEGEPLSGGVQHAHLAGVPARFELLQRNGEANGQRPGIRV